MGVLHIEVQNGEESQREMGGKGRPVAAVAVHRLVAWQGIRRAPFEGIDDGKIRQNR